MVEYRRFVDPDDDHFGVLLVLLLVSLVVTAFDGSVARAVVAVVHSMLLVIAFRTGGVARSRTRLGVVMAIAVLAVVMATFFDPFEAQGSPGWLAQAAVLSVVVVVVVGRIIRHERVSMQTIFGALSLYVLIGLVFGMLYGAIDAATVDPILTVGVDGGSDDPIYYSFVTLTTVGFGDVTSTLDAVRRITIVEAIVGQVFLATMVARLVSMYGTTRVSDPDGPGV